MPKNPAHRTRRSAAAEKATHNQAVIRDAEARTNFKGKINVAFAPKTQNQRLIFESCLKSPLVVADGPAGTGKSYAGLAAAVKLLSDKYIDTIVLTRNPLPTGTSVGFFKGSDEEKMAIWLAPALSTLKKILRLPNGSDGLFNYLLEQKKIVMQPMETVKGSSYDRAFIVVEEAQECSMEQLRNLSTRVGEESVIFFNGDVSQSNDRMKGALDYDRFVRALEAHNQEGYAPDAPDWDKLSIPVFRLTEDDCVRSDITRLMLKIFNRHQLR